MFSSSRSMEYVKAPPQRPCPALSCSAVRAEEPQELLPAGSEHRARLGSGKPSSRKAWLRVASLCSWGWNLQSSGQPAVPTALPAHTGQAGAGPTARSSSSLTAGAPCSSLLPVLLREGGPPSHGDILGPPHSFFFPRHSFPALFLC